MEFKIPNLRYIGLIFQVNSFQNRRIVKRCRSMLIFHTPWKHQKTTDF